MKKKFQKSLFTFTLIIIMVLSFVSCSAESSKHQELPKNVDIKKTDYSSLKSEFTEIINNAMKEYNVTGASVALVDGNDTVWVEGFGYADKEAGKKVSSETLFKIGSIAKTFTGLSIMQLADKGLISIDSPIKKYIPDFSIIDTFKNSGPVTVKNIMTHHSGLPSDIHKDFLSERPFEDVVQMFKEQYRAYPAEYTDSYSNAAISLLGVTIENVSGMDFVKYTDKNIFEPLNMKNSGFILRDNMKPLFTKCYNAKGKEDTDILIRDLPAGGVISNSEDMSNYMKMFLNEGTFNGKKIISKDSINKTWEIQNKNNEFDSTPIGLIWFINENKEMGKITGHDGVTKLFNANMVLLPEQKLGVIIMTNSETGGLLTPIADEILKRAFELKAGKMLKNEPSPIPADLKVSNEELNKIEGDYSGADGLVKIASSAAGIVINLHGEPVNFIKKADGNYYCGMPDFYASFKNINGKDMMILNQKFGESVYKTAYIKLFKKDISEIWNKHAGNYIAEDNKSLLSGIKINLKAGYIFAERILNTGAVSEFILVPETDFIARSAGVGRNMNEVYQFINENGKDIILFSGLRFIKTK